MSQPVMQQEWQRRQTQRSLWVLLGVLALVSAVPQAGLFSQPAAPAAVLRQLQARANRQCAVVGHEQALRRYWRATAPDSPGAARRWATADHGTPPPSQQLPYLRRFCRPPTS